MVGINESSTEKECLPRKFQLWLKRVGWLILIWAGSVITLAIIAYAMRFLMNTAGLNT